MQSEPKSCPHLKLCGVGAIKLLPCGGTALVALEKNSVYIGVAIANVVVWNSVHVYLSPIFAIKYESKNFNQ